MYGGAGLYPSKFLGQDEETTEAPEDVALSATGDRDIDAAWTEYDTAVQDAYVVYDRAIKAYEEALCLADKTLAERIVAVAHVRAERTAA